jgi:integrase/recombinase XerD
MEPLAVHATQLDIANIKRWASQNFKPRTVSLNRNLIHLGAIFHYLANQGVIPDDPTTHDDNVTVQQEAPKWLDRNELNALIRAVRKDGNLRELTIITVLLHTGLRVQELCYLRLKDVVIGDRSGNYYYKTYILKPFSDTNLKSFFANGTILERIRYPWKSEC